MISFKEYRQQIAESKDEITHLEHHLREKYPEIHSLYLHHRGNDIKLDTLVIKKEHRKQGIGSKVLHDIKNYADKHAKRIILTAGVRDKDFGTTSQSRLDKFYKRNGFVANKGRNKDFSIIATHYYVGKGHISESVDHPMIEVDGVMRHRNNSLGQPIHHTDEGIKNFHRWFGDSTTVDEHGRPKVMYHGTMSILTRRGTEGGIREFKSKYGNPHWVSETPELANMYSGRGSTSNILPVYIKSIHPYKSDVSSDDDWAYSRMDVTNRILDQSPLKNKIDLYPHIDDLLDSAKHDDRYQALWNAKNSVNRFRNMGFDSIHHYERGANTYAVMDSNQIKSAISNSGRFKQNSNQIDESNFDD